MERALRANQPLVIAFAAVSHGSRAHACLPPEPAGAAWRSDLSVVMPLVSRQLLTPSTLHLPSVKRSQHLCVLCCLFSWVSSAFVSPSLCPSSLCRCRCHCPVTAWTPLSAVLCQSSSPHQRQRFSSCSIRSVSSVVLGSGLLFWLRSCLVYSFLRTVCVSFVSSFNSAPGCNLLSIRLCRAINRHPSSRPYRYRSAAIRPPAAQRLASHLDL